MAPYRVLVVDDSPFMRKIISDLILQDQQFVIASTAVNGVEAVAAAVKLKPDVITMDLEMPMMNGIEALQLIMKATPTPVIMLSGISEVNTRDTIKALQYGAFDFIRKPSSAASNGIDKVGENLLEKLRIAVFAKQSKEMHRSEHTLQAPSQQKEASLEEHLLQAQASTIASVPTSSADTVHKQKWDSAIDNQSEEQLKQKSTVKKPNITEQKTMKLAPRSDRSVIKRSGQPDEASKQRAVAGTAFKHLVAIGTSTGGPRALHEVVSALPRDFPAPVLIVQHMPAKFTRSLAQRLDSFSAVTVVEAEQGMRVAAGHVYIAPGGKHMELDKDARGYAIRLSDHPQRNGHRPSVDVLFESLVPFAELERHAVIMTGMGSDGAKGMKSLSEHGASSTIAESEETCIVYGMPRSAVECGAAQCVLPLQGIASRLISSVLKEI